MSANGQAPSVSKAKDLDQSKYDEGAAAAKTLLEGRKLPGADISSTPAARSKSDDKNSEYQQGAAYASHLLGR